MLRVCFLYNKDVDDDMKHPSLLQIVVMRFDKSVEVV
jgi:hypothetical protein